MMKINSRMILPAVTVVIGLIWVVLGLVTYGWWVEGRPGSGFFPSIVGGLLAVMSVLAILQSRKEDPPRYMLSHAYPLLAAVGVVLLALGIGFFPALFLYVFGWLKWYEKYNWKVSLITGVVTVAAMYGIFSLWLRVPFPGGLILRLITG